MPETSRFWPFIRAIGKALTIPGTNIGPSILTDIQDQRSADQFERDVKGALAAIRRDTRGIADRLERDEDVRVTEQALAETACQLAEQFYLERVAAQYLYADFKGIEQLEKLVSLRLDEVFVDLRVAPERWEVARDEPEAKLLKRMKDADEAERAGLEGRLAEHDVERIRALKGDAKPQPVGAALARPGGVVLLGGPGSGKTTLVKRLARSCALGAEVCKERYGEMPWCLPVVLPMAIYAEHGGDRPLMEFVRGRLDELGGQALVDVFDLHWGLGECLVLLDGLDEVVDAGRRIGCARAVGHLIQHDLKHNRLVVTSRPVGYSICRLSVPAAHFVLQPFERGDVETFARQWQLAYERAIHPEHPDLDQARTEADQLIAAIRGNPRVESLATNPLMLTIIALIKHQNVALPERRVELYELALNTLIRSWNKARSLANRPVGAELMAEETKKVWANVAHWMHETKSTGTCHRAQLHDHLVDVLTDLGRDPLTAEQTAESYIAAVAESAGLLEERGANVFAFMHQTFQEYLAARYLAIPHRQVIRRVRERVGDPRWHEVIRLTAGYIGVIQEDDEMVTELVAAIAEEDEDPLEPYLCTSLRLAASCIADEVRVQPTEVNHLVVRICERLPTLPYEQTASALYESLHGLRRVTPDIPAVAALVELSRHERWEMRMEAARMLARAPGTNTDALACLQRLFADDGDPDVKAHAALGLWRTGKAMERDILTAIVHGIGSSRSRMTIASNRDFVDGVLELLEDEEAHVRPGAAGASWEWGPRSSSAQALVKLLRDGNADARFGAAVVLSWWGRQSSTAPALVKLLEDENAGVRLQAAEMLGWHGAQLSAVPLLVKLLEDDSTRVRLRAAEVLGRHGGQSSAVPALVRLTEDDDTDVRFRAVEMLAEWGHRSSAVPALVKLIEDDNTDARFRAAEMLGEWGHKSSAVPALVKLLEDDNTGVQFRAAEMLRGSGHESSAVLALVRLLEDDSTDVQFRAAEMLRKSGHESSAVPVLMKLLEDEEANVRLRAAEALGKWGHKSSAVPLLVKLLEDDNTGVQFRAAKMLGGSGHESAAVPVLVKLLEDDDADVRLRAAEVLGKWGRESSAIPVLVKLLKDEDTNVQSRAAEVLGGWGPESSAVPALVRLLEDDDADVRSRAAEVLGRCGCRSSAARVLVGLLGHEEGSVRSRAAAVLGGWGCEPSAVPLLIALLKHVNASVRYRAAEVLGRWDPQSSALPGLVELLHDEKWYVRSRAASALGGWDPQSSAVAKLVRLLDDENTSVRSDAAAVLGRWGPESSVATNLVGLLEGCQKSACDQMVALLSRWAGERACTESVLGELVDGDIALAVAYFERTHQGSPQRPDRETARLLARCIEPGKKDSPHRAALRKLVFDWVWNASEGGT